jgi:hypothetical protein
MTINTQIDTPEYDAAITRIFEKMTDTEPGTKEFAALVSQLAALTKVREIEGNLQLKEADAQNKQHESNLSCELKLADIHLKEKEFEKPDRVSKDTLAIIAANLAGIALVLSYERMNVIASKAFGAVMKLR